jgi:hypothetical protein
LINKQQLLLFTILFCCTLFIFGFSHYGATLYKDYSKESNVFSDNTVISNVNISGTDETNARNVVQEQISKWKKQTSIKLLFKEKEVEIDINEIGFNIDKTFENISNGENNYLYVNLTEAYINNLLKSSSIKNMKIVNIKELQNKLTVTAEALISGDYIIYLEDYIIEGGNPELEINQTFIELDEKEESQFGSELLSIEIDKYTQFSLLNYLEKQGYSFDDDLINKIASGIYSVILPTNFHITERNISEILPDYIQLGNDAIVNQNKGKDLVFFNPNASSYKINILAESDLLYISLNGPSFLYEYKIKKEDVQVFKPKTVIQYDPYTYSSAKVVKRKGKDGSIAKVYREVSDEHGNQIANELISEDFYPPIHFVEVRGLINDIYIENENTN